MHLHRRTKCRSNVHLFVRYGNGCRSNLENRQRAYVYETTDNTARIATRWDKSPAVSAVVAMLSQDAMGCFQLYWDKMLHSKIQHT
jgi:hypothetical protein